MKPVEYAFVSPDGKLYRGRGIRPFARQHGLCEINMQHVHSGDRNHYKGWTAYDGASIGRGSGVPTDGGFTEDKATHCRGAPGNAHQPIR